MTATQPEITATPFVWKDPATLPIRGHAEGAYFEDVDPAMMEMVWEAVAEHDAAHAVPPEEPEDQPEEPDVPPEDPKAQPEEPKAANDNKAEAPTSVIKTKTLKLVGTENVPRREFLYGKHLLRKFLTVTVAPAGVGKTTLTATDALAMATGQALLDYAPERPLRVLYVNAEDPMEEIERKFEATARRYGVRNEDIADRILMSSGRDSDFVVAVADSRSGGVRYVVPVIDAIVEHAAGHSLDVMIVDPFVSTHSVNENDNGAIQKVAAAWVSVANELGCAIELVHHTVKGEYEVTADSGRGAGALVAKARAVRTLNRMAANEAHEYGVPPHERFSYFRVDLGKANLTKSGGQSEWYRIVSVAMGNGQGLSKPQDHDGVVERWYPPSKEERAASAVEREGETHAKLVADVPPERLAIIKVQLLNSDHKNSDQAKNWAGYVVAHVLGMDADEQADRQRIKGMIQAWIDAHELKIVRLPDIHRKSTPHVKPVAAP